MSLKNVLEKNHNNISTEYGKAGTAGIIVFGWMLMGSLIYTTISIARKIIRK